MRPRLLAFLAALILCASMAVALDAQTGSTAASMQSGAQAGQAGGPSSQPASVATAPSADRKVWTNDDVGALRDDSTISTFSKPNAKGTAAGSKPGPKGRDPRWYQDQISRLQKQIPPLDSQIADLQAAIEGKPTGNGKTSTRPYGVRMDNWPAELDQLQKKRADILGRIEALKDEARHNGISPNALP